MEKNSIINDYVNGNVHITLYSDGTKVLECPDDETPNYEFPTSMDVKITNYCDLNCPYCHEQSTEKGKHGNLTRLLEIISVLPKGTELALGGGNPLSHPDLLPFLEKTKEMGYNCSMTVNQSHVTKFYDLISTILENGLIKGIGVSYRSTNHSKEFKELANYPHTVIHLINGIDSPEVMDKLLEDGFKKHLILGYKTFGNGVEYVKKHNDTIQHKIFEWEKNLYKFFGKCIICFDNLAIEQLNMRKRFTQKGWDAFYIGDDFTHTMYVDAIEETYTPTSRSEKRVKWNNQTLVEFFKSDYQI